MWKAKDRGFRTPSAFIRAAIQSEVKSRHDIVAFQQEMAKSFDRAFDDFRSVLRGQQALFALVDSLTRVVLTCVQEPDDDVKAQAIPAAKDRYVRLISRPARQWRQTPCLRSRLCSNMSKNRDEREFRLRPWCITPTAARNMPAGSTRICSRKTASPLVCCRQSSKPTSSNNKGKPGSFLDEFFRHREIFRSDVIRSVRERLCRRPRPHRLDEFPVGYSSAGCSPTVPASASPTGHHSALPSSCRSTTNTSPLKTLGPTRKLHRYRNEGNAI